MLPAFFIQGALKGKLFTKIVHVKSTPRPLKHLGTPRALGHLGTWALKELGHSRHLSSWALGHWKGTWVLEALFLADSKIIDSNTI